MRLAPRFERLGQVAGAAQGRLLLTDTSTNLDSIAASAARLEPTSLAFERCVQHVFREHSVRVKQELEKQVAQYLSGPKRLQKLQTVVERLTRLNLEMAPGANFSIRPFLTQKQAATFPAIQTAAKPVYVFDAAGTRTHTWNDGGLKEHGPYSGQSLTPARPQVCVICQRHRKEQVERFLHKFLHGIPPSKREKSLFAEGFLHKYAVADLSLEFFLANGSTVDAYQRAALSAMEQQRSGHRRWNLVLIQADEFFRNLDGESNPGLVAKAHFLTHGIATHEFEIESTYLRDSQLSYVLNNMALACYAKMGGIPWLLQSNANAAHELVIGLASASISEGQMCDRERVVGIITLFTGDGNYQFSNLSSAVPVNSYQDALFATLQAAINHIWHDMNWQPHEPIRMAFHAFQSAKQAEVNAVRQVMAGLRSCLNNQFGCSLLSMSRTMAI